MRAQRTTHRRAQSKHVHWPQNVNDDYSVVCTSARVCVIRYVCFCSRYYWMAVFCWRTALRCGQAHVPEVFATACSCVLGNVHSVVRQLTIAQSPFSRDFRKKRKYFHQRMISSTYLPNALWCYFWLNSIWNWIWWNWIDATQRWWVCVVVTVVVMLDQAAIRLDYVCPIVPSFFLPLVRIWITENETKKYFFE